MKKLTCTLFWLFSLSVMFICTSCSQSDDTTLILKNAVAQCQSIEKGYYDMTFSKKYMDDNDTTVSHHVCHFMKVKNDDIFGFYFNDQESNSFNGLTYCNQQLYFGDSLIAYYDYDSTWIVYDCGEWSDNINRFKHNFDFFTLFTDKSCSPLVMENALTINIYDFESSETTLHGDSCYLVTINEKINDDKEDDGEYFKSIRHEMKFWILKDEFLPIQYSVAFDIVEQNDTLYQYELFTLNDYSFDDFDENLLSMKAVPENATLKDYEPYVAPELLSEDTLAPLWALPDLNGDTISLADLKGKVVLIDFFYKRCGYCCMAFPQLENLYEKYKDKDFAMFGIDPMDDPEKDQMADFIAKRNVTYPVLFSDRDLPEEYNVSAYPTLYLIGKDGTILHNHVGYSETLEEEIGAWMEEALTK